MRGVLLPKAQTDALPSRDEVLAFLSGAPAPNGVKPPARVTKRDVARAFGVKGAARTELKLLIKDLESDGAVTRGRKVLRRKGVLPAMVVADIVERDRDGELIARPVDWAETGEPPRIRVRSPRLKREKAPAPGIGARVLLRIDADSEGESHSGRVVKVLDRARARALGVYRELVNGAGRVAPIDKKGGAREILSLIHI